MVGYVKRPQKSNKRGKQTERSFRPKQGKGCSIFENVADQFLLYASNFLRPAL